MSRAVHQLVSGFAEGDAISHCARTIQRNLRAMGFRSDIVAEDACISPSMQALCTPLSSWHPSSGETVLFHASIASRAADRYLAAPCRRILIYHNITPAAYFDMLRMLVGDYDLANVCFEGFASPEGLPSYYRSADLYVCTSEHEGYCLPLLEAMHLGVPVISPTASAAFQRRWMGAGCCTAGSSRRNWPFWPTASFRMTRYGARCWPRRPVGWRPSVRATWRESCAPCCRLRT